MNQPETKTGVIIVDHGSRRAESNAMLLELVELFASTSHFSIVEPAHMELAEPSIATAFARCVKQGAELIVVYPYFLLPGRHWDQDIPKLAAQAAVDHPSVTYLVAAPLGLHPLMAEVIQQRIEHCLGNAQGTGGDCELCRGTRKCRFNQANTAGS